MKRFCDTAWGVVLHFDVQLHVVIVVFVDKAEVTVARLFEGRYDRSATSLDFQRTDILGYGRLFRGARRHLAEMTNGKDFAAIEQS